MSDRKPVKTRRVSPTAAELYQVQPDYQRFNQKYNMTRRGMWEETGPEKSDKRRANFKRLAQSGSIGYSVIDWGFFVGARANFESLGFNNNRPNWGGNSWQASPKLAKGGSLQPSASDERLYEKWQSSPEEASWLVRKMGHRFGADLVGLCHLDRRWVYSHWFDQETRRDYPIVFSDEPGYESYTMPTQLEDKTQVIPKEMKYVVVFLHEMGEDEIAAAPTLAAMAETQLAYSKLSFTAIAMAEFIRGLGYNAIPSANCTALSVPLAIDAGLGQLGRNAKLINPLFGPRCRISKVITDLPLAADIPIDLGVTEFCNQCQKCAQTCPTGAIPSGKQSFEPVNDCSNKGYLQWPVDHKKCSQYWAEVATNCGICLRVCPFNKGRGKVHDVARWFIKNYRAADPLFVKLDDALGYGKYRPSNKLWYQS
ncbi:reductive dehalogenase [Chloroflexota bacterium]